MKRLWATAGDRRGMKGDTAGGFAPLDDASMAAVLDDADELFHYEEGNRPQERAHAYLEYRGLARGVADTAMQCAVKDLVRRAAGCGDAGADGRALDAAMAAMAELPGIRDAASRLAMRLSYLEGVASGCAAIGSGQRRRTSS